jgi:hypothetical protein
LSGVAEEVDKVGGDGADVEINGDRYRGKTDGMEKEKEVVKDDGEGEKDDDEDRGKEKKKSGNSGFRCFLLQWTLTSSPTLKHWHFFFLILILLFSFLILHNLLPVFTVFLFIFNPLIPSHVGEAGMCG